METTGDKYMIASGMPEKTSVHAKNVALVALEMLDMARDTPIDDAPVQVRHAYMLTDIGVYALFIDINHCCVVFARSVLVT